MGLNIGGTGNGKPYHFESMGSFRHLFCLLVRGDSRRYKAELIQVKAFPHLFGNNEMSPVNRVEGTSKNAELFQSNPHCMLSYNNNEIIPMNDFIVRFIAQDVLDAVRF